MTDPRNPNLASRTFWWIVGWGALAVGFVGIFLPVLPTTPLVLLAAFSFTKGSPRMRAYLENHRVFGEMIRDWEEKGAIPRKYKIMAVALMSAAFTYSVALGLRPGLLALQAACMIPAGIYVWTRPDG